MNSTVNPNYSFNVEHINGAYVFNYKRAKISPAILVPAYLLNAPLMFLLSLVFKWKGGTATTWYFILPIGLYILVNLMRRPGAFAISNRHITVGGQNYERSHIHELYIKAPGVKEERVQINNTMFYAGSSHGPSNIALGATAAMGTIAATIGNVGSVVGTTARNSIRKQLAKVNYQIGFMYGERHVLLADGLKENSASVMYGKVYNTFQHL